MDLLSLYLIAVVMAGASMVVLIFAYLYHRSFTLRIETHMDSVRFKIFMIFLASAVGVVCARYVVVPMDGLSVGVKEYVIMFVTYLGGPLIGGPVAGVVALERVLAGDPITGSCVLTCGVSFTLSALLWLVNGRSFPNTAYTTALVILAGVLSYSLILIFLPAEAKLITINYAVWIALSCAITMCFSTYFYHKKIENGEETE